MAEESRKQFFTKQLASLENERTTFDPHWRELSDFILPRGSRFLTSDRNKSKRNTNIIDPTATLANRTLSSGMLSGITSPTRPWFTLGTPDPDMMDYGPVKLWLETVRNRMNDVLNKSNWYQSLPIVYGQLGTFGTNAMALLEDDEDVIRTHPFPIGSYYLSNSDRLQVDTVYRKFSMTCRQIVQKFGLNNVSNGVKSAWASQQYEQWFEIVHVVEPNINRDTGKLNSKNKRISSVYYEHGGDSDQLLSESGFDDMPIMAPRWDINGEDAYGSSCPGMIALGGVKALQLEQRRKAQAIDKLVNPPMVGPTSLKNQRASLLPGEITYVDQVSNQTSFQPAYAINPRISELVADIQDTRELINSSYFVDLFMMLANNNPRSMAVEAVTELKEEKLLMLGPVLERLNDEFLDPSIDRVFNIMARKNMFPPAPQELAGMPLRVEYISVMAQAQKAIGIGAIERFVGFVGGIAQAKPEAFDKINVDKMIDDYGNMVGVPATTIASNDDVQAIRAQRAEQQQKQQAFEQSMAAAQGAKALSDAKTSEPSALTAITGAMQQ
ncbi:portal protein [Rouxiella badensis]|uniref:portal protein n=1 Tax=Rouxiella badensis TaxID=1646377 RepID=UPI001D13597E|nr:portal protein [Rouxiella badensis]MCC3733701.1 portal protein [Rouxiella badensis]MCC3759646.1 portal protein [Rouxiella badensis]